MLTLLIILFVVLVVVGVGTFYAPMDPKMKNIIYAATGVVTFIVLLVFFNSCFNDSILKASIVENTKRTMMAKTSGFISDIIFSPIRLLFFQVLQFVVARYNAY